MAGHSVGLPELVGVGREAESWVWLLRVSLFGGHVEWCAIVFGKLLFARSTTSHIQGNARCGISFQACVLGVVRVIVVVVGQVYRTLVW